MARRRAKRAKPRNPVARALRLAGPRAGVVKSRKAYSRSENRKHGRAARDNPDI